MINRIFKEYNFNFNHPLIKSKNIIFSSYPATLSSNDDFYITSKNLVIIETSNVNYNNNIYNNIKYKSLLCWMRVMIANRLSENGNDWIDNFMMYNSGTYNNMFMALDMNKINLTSGLVQDEALYIVDQMPTVFYTKHDVSWYLRFGYWPSYIVRGK